MLCPRQLFSPRVVGLSVLVALFCPVSARAFCSQPDPRVCTEFFASDAVFVGTVVSVRNWPKDDPSPDGWFYRLRLEKIYRGPQRQIIEVFTGNDSARFPLELGHKYLLFASRFEGRRLEIGNCGNSGEFPEAQEVVRQVEQVLRDMKTASSGDIRGHIRSVVTGAGIAGIRVVARRGDKSYEGFTDKEGWFHIQVQPGKYSVSPFSGAWSIELLDISYNSDERLIVVKGGCADLQFLATPK